MISILNKNVHLLVIWLFLTSSTPFIIYSWPFHPHKKFIIILMGIMVAALIKVKKVEMYTNILYICFVLALYYSALFCVYNDVAYLNLLLQVISISLLSIYLAKFVGYPYFIKSFIYILIAMGIGGFIILWLHFFIGVSPLFSVNYSGPTNSYFLYLTTTNSYTDYGDLRILRFAGFFDESGAFSMFSFFALLLNRLYYKNKKAELLLIFFTFFSFSLAYIGSLCFYYLLFYVNRKNLYKVISLCVFIIICSSVLNVYKDENPSVKRLSELTFERLEKTEDGDFKGNTRINLQENDKQLFLKNPFFGAGLDSVRGANIYEILAQYGLFGSLIHYSPYILLLILIFKSSSEVKKEGLKIFLLLLINLWHRPNISSVLSMIITFCFIHYYISHIKTTYLKSSVSC